MIRYCCGTEITLTAAIFDEKIVLSNLPENLVFKEAKTVENSRIKYHGP